MNDESPVSVDISVAFFASVLVLFVFVTMSLNHDSPRLEKESTGQINLTTSAIPASWSPIPERTTYAFLGGNQLQILDLNHFSDVLEDSSKLVINDKHSENIFLLTDSNAPESFFLNISTTGGELPSEWVRDSLLIVLDKEKGCGLREHEQVSLKRQLLTVLVMQSSDVSITEFVAFADACNFRYRLTPIETPRKSGRVSIPISLQPSSFRAETIFR